MNIPKLAIDLAKKGGWYKRQEFLGFTNGTEPLARFRSLATTGEVTYTIGLAAIALDRDFWVALGKALGWQKTICRAHLRQDTCGIVWTDTVLIQAHRFYDLILTGGNIEKFWEELLN